MKSKLLPALSLLLVVGQLTGEQIQIKNIHSNS